MEKVSSDTRACWTTGRRQGLRLSSHVHWRDGKVVQVGGGSKVGCAQDDFDDKGDEIGEG